MYNLEDEYYNWMYSLVCNQSRELSFHKLMSFLHNTKFEVLMKKDDDRVQNAIDFRYRFGCDNGYSREEIKYNLSDRLETCSILEIMISLSFKIENCIMDDPDYGNRTGQWFWNMIVSLGLGSMDDSHFNERYVSNILFRFINRDYHPNGKGGLFTLENPYRDLRFVDIWNQAMWYLDENFDFTVTI